MTAPRSITVPAGGLSEKSVRAELGLERGQLHALMETGLGAPHDYSWPPNAIGYVFTAAGVRRLLELTRTALDVIEEAPAATPTPRGQPGRTTHHHGDRANGYQPQED